MIANAEGSWRHKKYGRTDREEHAMEELLEQLKNAVHAEYISDLPHLPDRRWALVLLEDMPLGRYSLWELSAVASYLLKCRVSFSSYEAARHCFRMALNSGANRKS